MTGVPYLSIFELNHLHFICRVDSRKSQICRVNSGFSVRGGGCHIPRSTAPESRVSCQQQMMLISGHNITNDCHRSCRRLRRNCGWLEMVWRTYDDDCFKRSFRVSKKLSSLFSAAFIIPLNGRRCVKSQYPQPFVQA